MAEIQIPDSATKAVSNAFNWKLLLMVVIIAIIVSWIINKLYKPSFIIKDANGNVTGTGEITRAFNKSIIPAGLQNQQPETK